MQKKIVIGVAAAVVLGAVLFVYAGVFNVAADEHHSKPFYALMETVRERSIAVRSRGILVPPLDDSAMISSGGADYNEMCTGCHLRPGIQESELSAAMYPQPPNLSQIRRKDPAQTFWIIKHGIKMSGMPAWGPTHDDQRMWAMVAFLQRLPELTPEQYQILTARTDDDMDDHEEPSNGSKPMPGMEHK